jgi:hypothetical protein
VKKPCGKRPAAPSAIRNHSIEPVTSSPRRDVDASAHGIWDLPLFSFLLTTHGRLVEHRRESKEQSFREMGARGDSPN